MILTDRDIRILAFILRYKYVTTDHIYNEFFSDMHRSSMSKVLKRLEDMRCIKQQTFPRTSRLTFGNLLYLTDRGAKCVADEWETTVDRINYRKVVYPIQSINHFYHRKREIDFWIRLDKDLAESPLSLKDIATDGQREMRGKNQVVKTHIETSDGRHKLIPDLYFILRNDDSGNERVYFVEIDTGKETIGGQFKVVPENSLIYKYQLYEKIMEDGNWQAYIDTSADVFEVLTVTEKMSHVRGIQKNSQRFIQWKHLFLLSTHELVEEKGVLTGRSWLSLKGEGKPKVLLQGDE